MYKHVNSFPERMYLTCALYSKVEGGVKVGLLLFIGETVYSCIIINYYIISIQVTINLFLPTLYTSIKI